MNRLQISTFNDTKGFIGYNENIVCPCCHKTVNPKAISGHQDKHNQVTLNLYCRLCQNSFSAIINKSIKLEDHPSQALHHGISNMFPIIIEPLILSDTINDLSQEFSDIYAQAYEADQLGYQKVAGPGYRKALEFLIKDYAISKNKDFESNIKKMPLNQCIEKFVDHPRIKNISKRAAWLGNDETHYERNYTSLDIESFRTLIKLSIAWIELDIESEELESSIVHHSQL